MRVSVSVSVTNGECDDAGMSPHGENLSNDEDLAGEGYLAVQPMRIGQICCEHVSLLLIP